MNDKTATSGSSARQRARLNALGLIVLLVGLASAGVVYWRASELSASQSNTPTVSGMEDTWQDSTLAAADSKKATHDIELYYGKAGVFIRQWSDLMDALRRPESLALLIATIATLTALGCFFTAHRPAGKQNANQARIIHGPHG